MAKNGNVRVWAWDGSQFREILIDTLGHPQVDALSVANPPNLDKAISKLIDKSIVATTSTQTGTLASGTSEIITMTPPINKMWRYQNLLFTVTAPSGASSGSHALSVISPGGTYGATTGVSYYYTKLLFDVNHWRVADAEKLPPDEANLGAVLSRLAWTNANPVKFQYSNSTDVSQTNRRTYSLDTLEEYCG